MIITELNFAAAADRCRPSPGGGRPSTSPSPPPPSSPFTVRRRRRRLRCSHGGDSNFFSMTLNGEMRCSETKIYNTNKY